MFMTLWYLTTIALLLGYWAYLGKRRRDEDAAINRALKLSQVVYGVSRSVEPALQGILQELGYFYRASSVVLLIAVESGHSGLIARCQLGANGSSTIQTSDLSSENAAPLFFPVAASAWSIVLSSDRTGMTASRAIDAQGKPIRGLPIHWNPSLATVYTGRSLLGTDLSFGGEFSGRIVVLDANGKEYRTAQLRFLQRFSALVAPAIFGCYWASLLSDKISSIERSRIARDVHDGILQSLTGLALHIEARQNQLRVGETSAPNVAYQIRGEIQNLRGLIQELRLSDLKPGDLIGVLVEYAEKFGRDTGISAEVASDMNDAPMSPRVCREIAGIVREALSNVRKHSQAKHVVIRLSCTEDRWSLVINDDGRGFNFQGTLSLSDLDRMQKGPTVIKERVRLLNGDIRIDSRPGLGSQLEISAPL